MSQYSSSYNSDSLNDVFNIVNRKGKMQKKYLSLDYLNAAQEYREMRKELNGILKKKKDSRSEAEAARIEELKKKMGENAKLQKDLLRQHFTAVSLMIIDKTLLDVLSAQAKANPRLRQNNRANESRGKARFDYAECSRLKR